MFLLASLQPGLHLALPAALSPPSGAIKQGVQLAPAHAALLPVQASKAAAASRPQPAPPIDGGAFFGEEGAEPLKESLNEEDRRKRSRAAIEAASLESFLKDLGDEAGDAREEEPSRADDKGKRSAPGGHADAVAAAKTKAGRERARRERLNERWLQLSACCMLAHLTGPVAQAAMLYWAAAV